jgi:DNA polymerase-3 subunit alpha
MGYLIFDTETNGLPQCVFYGMFPLYNNLEKYNNARVVQVSYIITDDLYKKVEESDTIIKRDNYPIDNSQFHGITEERSDTFGISFIEFAQQFKNSLSFVHTLVAHNIDFDFNVICAELYRYNLFDVLEAFESKKQVCTMKKYKLKIGATFKNSKCIKDPNLKELYHYATGETLENHHNSMYDVLNLWKAVKALET